MALPDRDRTPLVVAIDARIPDGRWGGVQQVVQGLAHGLGSLDGPEQYVFLVNGSGGWLRPMISGPCTVREVPSGFGRTRIRRAYDALSARVPAATGLARRLAGPAAGRYAPIAASNGFVETLGTRVIHFATPQAFLTAVPSIYQPHDLLHRHHPEQLGAVHARYRDDTYRRFSDRASIVAVMTEWGRTDICEAFGLAKSKVAVVPWAPVTGLVPTGVRGTDLTLPDRFILYPAQTWVHKNHIRLIEALAVLRDEGEVVHLVCTGRQTEHMGSIAKRIRELRLDDQVLFAGYVSAADLDRTFQRATALVFPSEFEGWGLPVVEAFALGVPVACSNVTALPEVVRDAALLFDPASTESIAEAIRRIWNDTGLRTGLVERGSRRATQLSWDRTAKTFRALYRRVAGRELSNEDRDLLAPPTLLP